MAATVQRISLSLPLLLGKVNCYLIRTQEGCCLIDCGGRNQRGKLLKILQQAGIEQAGLSLIVLTHADFDHSGNAAFLQKQYGCSIAIHPAEMVRITARSMMRERKGIPELVQPFERVIYRFLPEDVFEPDLILADQLDLHPWKVPARVIATPGHTSGSVSVLTDDGDLFCGDLLVNRGTLQLNGLVDNQQEMRASLRRVLRLPCKRIHPGHGRSFAMAQLKKATDKWSEYDEK